MSKNKIALFVLAISCIITLSETIRAQTPITPKKPTREDILRWKINRGNIRIITGPIHGTNIQLASDLSTLLDSDQKPRLRIMPIAGKGDMTNIRDLLYLREIDLATVSVDALNAFNKNRTFGNIRHRIRYIAKLYDAELHILANREIKTIQNLNGKTVNVWHKGSMTERTAKNLFKSLGILPKFVHLDHKLAIEKTKKGEIAATLLVAGKPVYTYREIIKTKNVHFLPVTYDLSMLKNYLPSKISHTDYPHLIPKQKPVSTIAVPVVLIANNRTWDTRYNRKIAHFIDGFFSNIKKLRHPSRHNKWKHFNLLANVPGWTRFRYAEYWMKKNALQSSNGKPKTEGLILNLGLAEKKQNLTKEQQQEALFDKFLKWKNKVDQKPSEE